MMTGMRPNTTRVTNNEDNLYKNHPGVLTMPHHFRESGYATARCGKIFHLGVPSGLESMDDPQGWDFGTPFQSELPFPPDRKSSVQVKRGKKEGLGWQEIPQSTETWFLKIIGLFITAVAVSLGAPFWFELLSKLERVL